jgi:hypothetical protein
VAHDVDGGVLPGDQVSVMTYVGGLGDRHGDSRAPCLDNARLQQA